MDKTIQTTAEEAIRRSGAYSFLSLAYLDIPGERFFKLLRFPEVKDNLDKLGLDTDSLLSEHNNLKALEEEFTRLFIGPAHHLSPHESVHTEFQGSHWGEVTSEVQRFIELAGFDIGHHFPGMPDHISVELEFMGQMAQKEGLAWSEKNESKALDYIKIQSMFLDKHLLNWVDSFCDKVIESCFLSFYRELAKWTSSFLWADRKNLSRHDVTTTN